MSAQQPVSSSRGQRSIWIGRCAGSGPVPASWPKPCQTPATMTSAGAGAPCAAQASRSAARTVSASSGRPSTTSRSPWIPAERSTAAAAAIPASAAFCARRMPAISAPDFTRRRSANASWSGVSVTPSARSRSATASGKSGSTSASRIANCVDGPRDHLEHDLVARQAALEQLVEADVGVVEQLGVGPDGGDARALQGADQHLGLAVDFAVEERVADRDGDLVTQRRGALRVAVEQEVGHGADPIDATRGTRTGTRTENVRNARQFEPGVMR